MRFRDKLAGERVGDLNLREAVIVHSGTIVRGAVAQMRTQQVGCAVIVDFSNRPIGVFTERSLVEVLVHDVSLDNRPVGEFVDRDFLQVRHSDSVASVWDAVQQRGLRFVCVTNDENQLIGLTGQRGLAEYIADFFPRHVMVQRLGSRPSMRTREGA